MKILSISACANGNIGDMYQSDLIAHSIKLINPDAEVSSISPSKRQRPYPHDFHQIVSPSFLYDAGFLNSFDKIIVGGGGLISSPHYPLNDPAWSKLISAPIYGLSLGVVEKHAAESADFIKACKALSVRDEYSLAAISGVRSDVSIVMDPILLADKNLHTNVEKSQNPSGLMIIPGKLVPETKIFYSKLIEDSVFKPTDLYVSFNKETDLNSGFEDVFGDNVIYLDDIHDFNVLAAKSRAVISERYHGCIAAMRINVPTVGITLRSHAVTSKITEVFRKLGMDNSCLSMKDKWSRRGLVDIGNAQDYDKINLVMDSQRSILMKYLADILND